VRIAKQLMHQGTAQFRNKPPHHQIAVSLAALFQLPPDPSI
jgi:hypothetical protein